MSKLEKKKKDKKEALLKTAYNLFVTKGINKTSVSDIAQHAGVAKGTFYLYFKDKFEIRDKLIYYEAAKIFSKAEKHLFHTDISGFENEIIFIVDDVLDQLDNNKKLLKFISKNLSWGVFRSALQKTSEEEIDFYGTYLELIEKSGLRFKNPQLLLYMIVELVSSTCYSVILEEDPVTLNELKPHLFAVICGMIKENEIKEENLSE